MKTINDKNLNDKIQYLIEDTAEDTAKSEAAHLAFWARTEANETRATAATAAGAQALARLLTLAETRDSGQIQRVALFLGASWNGCRYFDFYDLRALDVAISDDMLAVLDALRWAKVAIEDLVPDGHGRIRTIVAAWGTYGPDQTGPFICIRE